MSAGTLVEIGKSDNVRTCIAAALPCELALRLDGSPPP